MDLGHLRFSFAFVNAVKAMFWSSTQLIDACVAQMAASAVAVGASSGDVAVGAAAAAAMRAAVDVDAVIGRARAATSAGGSVGRVSAAGALAIVSLLPSPSPRVHTELQVQQCTLLSWFHGIG